MLLNYVNNYAEFLSTIYDIARVDPIIYLFSKFLAQDNDFPAFWLVP